MSGRLMSSTRSLAGKHVRGLDLRTLTPGHVAEPGLNHLQHSGRSKSPTATMKQLLGT